MQDLFNPPCVFSSCRRYRYTLWRVWDPSLPVGQFIGLNPSKADDSVDDNTVRRCIRFMRGWGFGALVMTNIHAYRATLPDDMKAQGDPTGPDNDRHLVEIGRMAKLRVAAWGVHGAWRGRASCVEAMFARESLALHCLEYTCGMFPRHPLYVKKTAQPLPYPRRE